MEYVWIGEFGEMDNLRWNSLNNSGKKKNIGEFGEISHKVQLKESGSMSGLGIWRDEELQVELSQQLR